MNEAFETKGRLWFRRALCEQDLVHIENALDANSPSTQSQRAAGLAKTLVFLPALRSILSQFGANPHPTRVVSFNKSASSNWAVPWHQDRVVTAPEKHDTVGYKNWTNKNGEWHCEPPISVLNAMAFTRIHLDDTTDNQGPMEIALGSHALGFVSSDRAKQQAESFEIERCTAWRGDVLVLKMLTLHRSIASRLPQARRTLRADYTFGP